MKNEILMQYYSDEAKKTSFIRTLFLTIFEKLLISDFNGTESKRK